MALTARPAPRVLLEPMVTTAHRALTETMDRTVLTARKGLLVRRVPLVHLVLMETMARLEPKAHQVRPARKVHMTDQASAILRSEKLRS